ncbi:DUF4192 family protein [Mycetocola saprophilus]|uniref:DUF4192 family protein n=1 Tax=Mycetocola saprophilus TaxID=76636 RepID=UPI0004BE6F1B|nr:DUF4192 family protein [Mycetocola saprophilus]
MKPFHAHTPDAFLRVLPRLLGFAPRRCILLVAFNADHTCGLLRFDLPRRAGQTDLYEAAFGLLSAEPAPHNDASVVGAPPELGDTTARDSAVGNRSAEVPAVGAAVGAAAAGDSSAGGDAVNDVAEGESSAGGFAVKGGATGAKAMTAADVEWVRTLDNRARAMIGVFCRIPHAESILPVVYTDRSIGRIRASSSLPWRDFVGEVLTYAEIAGYPVRDALVVSGSHWGHYLAEPGTPAVRRLTLPSDAPPDR